MKHAWLSIVLAACGGGGGFPDAAKSEPTPPPGSFAVDWTLTDGSGASITCASANAATVNVEITTEVTGDEASTSFDCSIGGAVSGALPSATYDLTFALFGADGSTIATAPPQTGLVITADKTTDAAPVTFVVSP